MDGKKIKETLRREGRQLAELADAMGISQQNLSGLLNKDNVKTETLEAAARLIGKPVGYFYGESPPQHAVASDHSTVVMGAQNAVHENDPLFIREIAAQRRLTEQAMHQNDKLIHIIEELTNRKN